MTTRHWCKVHWPAMNGSRAGKTKHVGLFKLMPTAAVLHSSLKSVMKKYCYIVREANTAHKIGSPETIVFTLGKAAIFMVHHSDQQLFSRFQQVLSDAAFPVISSQSAWPRDPEAMNSCIAIFNSRAFTTGNEDGEDHNIPGIQRSGGSTKCLSG